MSSKPRCAPTARNPEPRSEVLPPAPDANTTTIAIFDTGATATTTCNWVHAQATNTTANSDRVALCAPDLVEQTAYELLALPPPAEEARGAKVISLPRPPPSAAEVESHEMIHMPRRDWRIHCVQGRGHTAKHISDGDPSEIPRFSTATCSPARESTPVP